MGKDITIKIRAVEAYNKDGSLRETALKFGIPHNTLWIWVNRYKQGSKYFYVKPWNRLSREVEEKTMLLKENNPSLTIEMAKKLLSKQGVLISNKGVYDIWKRYNFVKRSIEHPFSPFAPLTPETKCAIEYIRNLFKNKKNNNTLREAALILNNLPSYPIGNENILQEIPERLLSTRRKLDQLYSNFLEIPIPDYFKKIKRVRKTLEKRGYFYSSIIAGLLESVALHWMRTPEQGLKLHSILRKRKGNLRDPVINFELTLSSAMAYAERLQVEKVYEYARKCRRLLRLLPYSSFLGSYGDLMTSVFDYKEALRFYQKTLKALSGKKTPQLLSIKIVLCYIMAGEYLRAVKASKRVKIYSQNKYYTSYAINQAFLSFGLGELGRASFLFQEALKKAEKAQFRNIIYGASSGLASIAKSLGKVKESKHILEKCLPLMEKYRLEREVLIIKFMLGKYITKKRLEKISLFHLFFLLDKAQKNLKARDYKCVFDFAKKRGLINYFHRIIVFIPEPVLAILKKGKDTGLPRSILNLPVFRKDVPVYSVKFLGEFRVYKDQRYLSVRLTPKNTSFLIYLTSSREKSIPLDNIYENFWYKSKHPSTNLAHLLVIIRKFLQLPSHYLYVKEDKLCFNCYFTSDYGEYQEHLAQAKALERAGEWVFAKKEYLRAFALFRGAPFRKMYDPWSEHMRRVILNELETEALHFAKSCIAHDNEIRQKKRRMPSAKCRGGNMADVKKVLEKVVKIIPGSEEIREMVK